MTTSSRCPTCNSPAPHLHPAVQFEGEVSVCIDEFHLRETPQNIYIDVVVAHRAVAQSLRSNRGGEGQP